jgi:hypothetical protein
MATRKQDKARLKAKGLWTRFVALRDMLEHQGMTPPAARAEALRQLEGTPSVKHPTGIPTDPSGTTLGTADGAAAPPKPADPPPMCPDCISRYDALGTSIPNRDACYDCYKGGRLKALALAGFAAEARLLLPAMENIASQRDDLAALAPRGWLTAMREFLGRPQR